MTQINLTSEELRLAASVGIARQIDNIAAGRRQRHGKSALGDWQMHIEGACGEFAVAKFLGLFWSGNVGDLCAHDVGKHEVRQRSRGNYDLVIYEGDHDDSPYWLVTGLNGRYMIRGWIYGREGKKPEYFRSYGGRPPAYFVPQGALRAPSEWFAGGRE